MRNLRFYVAGDAGSLTSVRDDKSRKHEASHNLAGPRPPMTRRKLRFPACLIQLSVGPLCKAEIVSLLNRHLFVYLQNLANDIEIVSLRFFIDDPVAGETSDHTVVGSHRE